MADDRRNILGWIGQVRETASETISHGAQKVRDKAAVKTTTVFNKHTAMKNINQIWQAQASSAADILLPVLKEMYGQEKSNSEVITRLITELENADIQQVEALIKKLEEKLKEKRCELRAQQLNNNKEKSVDVREERFGYDADDFVNKAYRLTNQGLDCIVDYAPNSMNLGGSGLRGETGSAEEALLRRSDLLLHLIFHIAEPKKDKKNEAIQRKAQLLQWYLENLQLTLEGDNVRFKNEQELSLYVKHIGDLILKNGHEGFYNLLAKDAADQYKAFFDRDVLVFSEDNSTPPVFVDAIARPAIDTRTGIGREIDPAANYRGEEYVEESKKRLMPLKNAVEARKTELDQSRGAKQPIYYLNIPGGCGVFAKNAKDSDKIPQKAGQAVGQFVRELQDIDGVQVIFTGFGDNVFYDHLTGIRQELKEVSPWRESVTINENSFVQFAWSDMKYIEKIAGNTYVVVSADITLVPGKGGKSLYGTLSKELGNKFIDNVQSFTLDNQSSSQYKAVKVRFMGEVLPVVGKYSWGNLHNMKVILAVTPNRAAIAHDIGDNKQFSDDNVNRAYKGCYIQAIHHVAAQIGEGETANILLPLQGVGNMGWDVKEAAKLASEAIGEALNYPKCQGKHLNIIIIERSHKAYLSMRQAMEEVHQQLEVKVEIQPKGPGQS